LELHNIAREGGCPLSGGGAEEGGKINVDVLDSILRLNRTSEGKFENRYGYNEIRKKFLYNRLAGQSLLYGSRS